MIGRTYLFYLLLIVLRCTADESTEKKDDENRTDKRLQKDQNQTSANTTGTKQPNPWPEALSSISPYPPIGIAVGNSSTITPAKTTGTPKTTPPSIPRPPHFTAGSFFIGFFVATVTVGLVFAGVRLFMRHRAEPRAYTMY